MTQQYCLASMAPWLSSTGISYHYLLPHILSIPLFAVNSSPHPRIGPQSLSSSSQPLHLLGDLRPCLGYVWLWKDCLILILFRLHRSAVSLSALNVSPLTQTIAPCGDETSASVPCRPRSSPVLLTLLFFPLVPSSYRVLHISIYFFPLFKYSRLLSAGVLHAFLCLKVYS